MKKTFSVTVLILLLLLCGCGGAEKGAVPESEPVPELSASGAGNIITLSDSGSSCTGGGVTLSDGSVTITAGGEYTVTGTLSDGQLIVAAPKDEKVVLTMDDAEISCSDSAALYVLSADKLVLTLAEGSINVLNSCGSFVQTDENNVDAALFSKDDLTVKGSGALTVNCAEAHGIVGKDDLKINGGSITVTAAGKGISSNDSLDIKDGSISVDADDDALNCDGDITVSGGVLELSSGDDGIHSDAILTVSGGNISITECYEGLEGLSVNISGGLIDIVASDDGINAAGGNDSSGLDRPGGYFDPNDGFARPDGAQFGFGRPENPGGSFDSGRPGDVGGGQPDPGRPENPGGQFGSAALGGERPEAAENGASDDFGGFDAADSNASVVISGGELRINASGDGIDSNGTLLVTGGTVLISGPADGGNGAVDYALSGSITGGSFIAAGSSGMAMNFDSGSTQCSILCTFPGRLQGGTEVTLTDASGAVLAAYAPEKDFGSIVISVPALVPDGRYTVSAGDYSEEIELDGTLYGFGGMGAFGGQPGGFGGFRPGGGDGFDQNSIPGGGDDSFGGERPEPPALP